MKRDQAIAAASVYLVRRFKRFTPKYPTPTALG